MTARPRLCRWAVFVVLLLAKNAIVDVLARDVQIASEGCELYMAESTIPNAGLGIFTAVAKQVGDIVGNGDICIPLIEMGYHNGYGFFNPFVDYVWAGENMGQKHECGSFDIESFCPGLDCVINCNIALVNVGKSTPKFDDGNLHRSRDPGAGAITPYHNGTTIVKRDIPEGGELFKFYGDKWFTTRDKLFQNIPLSADYPKAEELLERYNQVGISFPNKDRLYDFLLELRSVWDSRTLHALPATLDEVATALENDIGTIHQPNATRSLSWLEEHGRCVDHIVPGQSTLPGAGRGAFAKRDLKRGTAIAGSPLLHLPFGQDAMVMYQFRQRIQGKWTRTKRKAGKQVVLNYCYGHDETSLLLCPYGAGVNYINHNQTMVNVKVQWAPHGTISHNASLLDLSLREMIDDVKPNLGIDYIATRNIRRGEELFLDYGDSWERAWMSHVNGWEPETYWADSYLNGHAWNDKYGTEPLRTEREAVYDPYPTTLQIRCHTEIANNADWREKYESNGGAFVWKPNEYGYPCRILKRILRAGVGESDDYLYGIEMTAEDNDRFHDLEQTHYQLDRPITTRHKGVPRAGIRFFDIPYTSDLHLFRAFRHEIGLPNDMVPDKWRNRHRDGTGNHSGNPPDQGHGKSPGRYSNRFGPEL